MSNASSPSAARNETVQILGALAAGAVVLVYLLISAVSCNATCQADDADARAVAKQRAEQYQQQLADCEAKFGVAQCWRVEYQHCLERADRTYNIDKCEALKPQPSMPALFGSPPDPPAPVIAPATPAKSTGTNLEAPVIVVP